MTTEKGKYKMKSFTDEHLCRLFEKFVLEYYRAKHPEYKAQAAQIDWNIDREVSYNNILPIMQTDILLTIHERTLVMNKDKQHSGKVDGMLLYAKTDEEITPDGSMKLGDGNTIYFRTLDLNVPFAQIEKQLEVYVSY